MKRLFIGIPIQCDQALQIVSNWQSDPSLNLNRLVWTKPANWHITLVFLGACPETVVPLLVQLMDEAFNQSCAFTAPLSGVGVFPEKGNPKVLWLGLQNSQPLLPAYVKIIEMLAKNKFLFDNKPLKPHLTLARVKYLGNRPPFEALLDEYHLFNFGTVTINRVTLFESISTSHGVVYQPLYEKWLHFE